jgi:hypothetical protein
MLIQSIQLLSAEHLFKGCGSRTAGDAATDAEPRSGASVRSPPAPTGGVRSTRRPRLQFACPVLCGQYLTRGNGHLCVSISSWAEEVRLHTVQPPQLGSTPSHPPGRPRRGGRSVCAGQVRRLRDGSTSRPLTTGGARTTIATGSPPRLRHLLRPPCGIQGGDFQPAGGGGIGLASEGTWRLSPPFPLPICLFLSLASLAWQCVCAAIPGCPRLLTQRSIRVPVVCAGLAASRGGYIRCWRLSVTLRTGRNAAQIARRVCVRCVKYTSLFMFTPFPPLHSHARRRPTRTRASSQP